MSRGDHLANSALYARGRSGRGKTTSIGSFEGQAGDKQPFATTSSGFIRPDTSDGFLVYQACCSFCHFLSEARGITTKLPQTGVIALRQGQLSPIANA
jgi:hypothetical protein